MTDERYDMIKKYNNEEEIENMRIRREWFWKEIKDIGVGFHVFLFGMTVIVSIAGYFAMGPFSLLLGFLLWKFVLSKIAERHDANKVKQALKGTIYEGNYPSNAGYLNAWINDFASLEGTIRSINNRKKMYYDNAISVLEREMEKCQ